MSSPGKLGAAQGALGGGRGGAGLASQVLLPGLGPQAASLHNLSPT